MEFLGTVALAFLPRSRIERIVTGHRLAGTGRGQHREQHRQVIQLVDDFLDTRKGNMNAGQGSRKPGIPFVFGDRNLARLGDEEVSTRDADIGVDVELTKVPTGNHRQFFRTVSGSRAEMFREEFADGLALHMHAREDKVVGGFAS